MYIQRNTQCLTSWTQRHLVAEAKNKMAPGPSMCHCQLCFPSTQIFLHGSENLLLLPPGSDVHDQQPLCAHIAPGSAPSAPTKRKLMLSVDNNIQGRQRYEGK